MSRKYPTGPCEKLPCNGGECIFRDVPYCSKPMTNYDRLMQEMTPEKLLVFARKIANSISPYCTYVTGEGCSHVICGEHWLEWLKQEVSDG